MWRHLIFQNELIEQGVQRMLRSGMVKIEPGTGMITPTIDSQALDYNSNWLFAGHTIAARDCYLWHQVMFNNFGGLVPHFCRFRCYKVVVKVRNFCEALQFYHAMLAAPLQNGNLGPVHGKVGIDERYYSAGAFNGFVYCDGLEDAQEKYKTVRKFVNELMPDGENIDIIIKRSCTEFEKKHGPTDNAFWQKMDEGDIWLEKIITDMFKSIQCPAVQPDWLKNKIIHKMVKWANAIGDKSWVDHFGGDDSITMKAVTYHDNIKLEPETEEEDLDCSVPCGCSLGR